MITRPESARKIRQFLVYDLEWVPGSLDLRIAGLFDGRTYSSFHTIQDFLNHVLTSTYRGKWFYAHSGGLHDIQFVFDTIVRNPLYSVEASFSGSSAIIAHIRRGHNVWHFVDSLWLLKGSLKEIGENLGLHKTGPTDDMSEEERKEWYATVDHTILREYNRNDCIVLWEAIAEFQLAILELGGQLQMTLASTGMHLFRRRYLQSPIVPSNLVNEKATEAYTASRVEVFEAECSDAYYYDVNSSFPHAMTFPVPGNYRRAWTTVPESYLDDDTKPLLALARVNVPDCYLPALPYRMPGKVFFPVGSWKTWFTGLDLRLLLESGGSIISVSEVFEFEPRWDLKDLAETLYARRMASDDAFHRMVYKLLMNSLYGKFAEKREKRTMVINPSIEKLVQMKEQIEKWNRRYGENKTLRDYMLQPGIFLMPTVKFIPHRHVPISAYITARARKTLFDFMSDVSDVHYCDTDGFSTSSVLQTSNELGGLKLEKKLDEAEYLMAKGYRLKGQVYEGGKWVDKTIVKAKGFSRGLKDDPDAVFDKLKAGEKISGRRMRRIVENFRKGGTVPVEEIWKKRVRLDRVRKRYLYPDGQTRPWHVRELKHL